VSDSLGPTVGQALALGLVQGPAELLPVSSSGHMALIAWLAGWERGELDPEVGKSFEIALHAGTAAALPIVMRKGLGHALRAMGVRGVSKIALSMGPPALVGYVLERPIEQRLSAPRAVAAGLLLGAVAMAAVDRAPVRRTLGEVRALDGIALGAAEALALAPGISRNGATLTAARALGFDRKDADSLSWIAALPVIFGAGTLKGSRLARRPLPRRGALAFATGVGASFFSTLAAGKLLRKDGRSPGSLLPYALYRCVLGAVVIGRLRKAGAHLRPRMPTATHSR
jgi:undecaprenyl-diphosphatase